MEHLKPRRPLQDLTNATLHVAPNTPTKYKHQDQLQVHQVPLAPQGLLPVPSSVVPVSQNETHSFVDIVRLVGNPLLVSLLLDDDVEEATWQTALKFLSIGMPDDVISFFATLPPSIQVRRMFDLTCQYPGCFNSSTCRGHRSGLAFCLAHFYIVLVSESELTALGIPARVKARLWSDTGLGRGHHYLRSMVTAVVAMLKNNEHDDHILPAIEIDRIMMAGYELPSCVTQWVFDLQEAASQARLLEVGTASVASAPVHSESSMVVFDLSAFFSSSAPTPSTVDPNEVDSIMRQRRNAVMVQLRLFQKQWRDVDFPIERWMETPGTPWAHYVEARVHPFDLAEWPLMARPLETWVFADLQAHGGPASDSRAA